MISSLFHSISAPANSRCHALLSALHLKTRLNRIHQTSRSRSITRRVSVSVSISEIEKHLAVVYSTVLLNHQLATQAAAQDDDAEGWVAKNQDLVRASPLIAGSLGIVSVILNRSFSGVSRGRAISRNRASLAPRIPFVRNARYCTYQGDVAPALMIQ